MNYATFEDVQWFSLDNYAGVLGKQIPDNETAAQRKACFHYWAMLIRDRVSLEIHWNAGHHDFVREQFEKLKRSPLTGLGFAKNTRPASQTSLITVRPLTSKRVRVLHDVLQDAADDSIADVAFKEKDKSLTEWAHLMIHTTATATQKQITADMKKWLSEHRNHNKSPVGKEYRSKIATWASRGVIPYFDLMFFATISGKSIKQHDPAGEIPTRGSLLNLGNDAYTISGNVRSRQSTQRTVINEAMAQVLSNLAEQEHCS